VTVVEVELIVWAFPDANEEDPGLYINVNWDDDDGDGWDPNDTPPGGTYTGDWNDSHVPGGDNDLRMTSLLIQPGGVPGNVTLTFGSNVKLWATNSKLDANGVSSEVSSGTAFSTGDLPTGFLIEGYSGSSSFGDMELKAQYSEASCHDIVKITVFEVDLRGRFGYGNQALDDQIRHSSWEWPGSSDKNGKISWDDANGDGTKGDNDPNCKYFHNCMETEGTVKPSGVDDEVEFDFDRTMWRRIWKKKEGDEEWDFVKGYTLVWESDEIQGDEDLSPSGSNHIYQTDGPGFITKERQPTWDYRAHIMDFREWVEVYVNGSWRQCSDYYKWHSKCYIKPKDDDYYTRDSSGLQALGAGWITVPDSP
jgi:hypothetical protein